MYERLRAANAALCIADSGDATTPLVATADWAYLRLRDEGYGPADLERWARAVVEPPARWRDVFVYFKHEESGTGPAFAREMIGLIDAATSTRA